MQDLARLLLAALWLVDLCLMVYFGYRIMAVRPYVYGLLLIPIMNVFFYIANFLWRIEVVSVPAGFFGELSNYRNWATAVNFLLVLSTAIIIEWMKQRQS
jgi:hypothetical protein